MAQSTFGSTPRREIELDFIRGLAILMVVDFHSPSAWLFRPFSLLGFEHFGWMGVDLFFVLSGFLVGGLLVKELKLRGRVDAYRFLIRRGLKIWPPYYVLLAIMLLTGHQSLRFLRGNLLNIQNYTGDGVKHTWSLAVEEHTYLILVLLMFLAARYTVRMRSLFLLLAITSAFTVLLRLTLFELGHPVYFETHTRIEAILYGVMLAMLYHYVPATFWRLQRQTWLWCTLIVLGLSFFRFHPAYRWTNSVLLDVANAISIATIMLLYRSGREERSHSFFYRAVAWVGLYSYGIYLWHVSIISPVQKLASRLPYGAGVVWLGVAPVAAAIVLGVFFTKLIEFPSLKIRDRLFPRRVDSPVGIPAETEAEQAASPLALGKLDLRTPGI